MVSIDRPPLGERFARLRHPLAAALFVGALAAAGGRAPAPAAPSFVPPPAPATAAPPRPFELSSLPGTSAAARSPSLTELADRRIAAAWIAGKPGDAREEAIWLALHDASGWQPAAPVLGREATAAATLAHVSRLDSPLLYAEGGWLHLWYAGAAAGATFGRALHHAVSTDGGRHWSAPRRLATSPLAVAGTRLGTPAVALGDGGIGLPLADAFPGRAGAWLRLAATGRSLDKQRLAAGGALPAVAALDEGQALAILAPGENAAAPLQTAVSSDGGQSWQAAGSLDFAVAAGRPALLRLRSGRLLLAGSPPGARQTLQLWLSDDGGRHWRASRIVETAADGSAAADPALLQARDGRIHLVYAGQLGGLRHARFDEAWLENR